MIIFINDIPVKILKTGEKPDPGLYNHVIDAARETITPAKMLHHVLVENAEEQHLDTLLAFLDSKVPKNLITLIIAVKDYDAIQHYFEKKFKVVKAAGGLVRKKEKYLMIYRLKKWDLPKGKKEKNEKYKQTAVREVEEECNITVKLHSKVCTTWHTYTMNKRAMLKKTKWYLMDCVDDSKMKPDLAEDIEECRWMNPKEVYHALEHSYKSISYVFERFYEQTEIV